MIHVLPPVDADLASALTGLLVDETTLLVVARGPDGLVVRRLDLPTSAPILVSLTAGGGCAVMGERSWADQRALEAQLWSSNDQLMVLLREQTRQARALAHAKLELEAAHRKLRDAHWHLDKISDVLPICLACRRVRTGGGEGSWEAVESYLVRSSTFLSHGYCARCADRLEALQPDAEDA